MNEETETPQKTTLLPALSYAVVVWSLLFTLGGMESIFVGRSPLSASQKGATFGYSP
tara:strand:- start:431 stop:601 length:171 start_codon:yes stop_codon:yes gene_type:complete